MINFIMIIENRQAPTASSIDGGLKEFFEQSFAGKSIYTSFSTK
jgi:hypothetical protein